MLLKLESIAALAFLIVEFYVLSLSTHLNIERGVRDIFDNPNCDSSNKNGCDCNDLNAECVDTTCKKCRCSSTNSTFRPSNNTNGRCVKDRYLLFINASSNSFLVRRIELNCIAPEWSNKLRTYYKNKKRTCNVTDSSQRWIWTPNNQLMHVNTLKCLQQGSFQFKGRNSGNFYFDLVLEECMSTQTTQLWQCLGQNIVNFPSNTSKLVYMYMYQYQIYIYGTNRDTYSERLKWNRWPSKQSLCLKAFGCYEFLESSILVTDIRNCPGQCNVEKEVAVPHEVGENVCFVIWEKLQHLANNEWKKLNFRDKIFNVHKRNKNTFLQLNFKKVTNNWTGLIVKLHFYCTRRKLTPVTTNIKCIVIKFNGATLGPPTVPPTESNVKASTGLVTEKILNTTGQAEKYKNDSSDVTVIIVCVVIVILILCGILGFIFYKRRRRPATTTAESREDDSAVTQPSGGIMQNPIYSTGDTNLHPFSFSSKEARYQEPQTSASQECELYESTGENNVYECTDVEQNGKRPLQLEHTYDYAKNDDVRPVAQRLPAVTSPVESKGEDYDQNSVYQTLEET